MNVLVCIDIFFYKGGTKISGLCRLDDVHIAACLTECGGGVG